MKNLAIVVVLLLGAAAAAPTAHPHRKPVEPTPPPTLSLTALGTVKTGAFRDEDPRIAEINAYDPAGRRVYVVNPLDSRLDVIDISDPAAPVPAPAVDIVGLCKEALGPKCPVLPGGEPNSIAIHGRLLAAAVANPVRTDNGHAVFLLLRGRATPQFLGAVEVGALPDMVTFTENGRYALVANEGEPDQSYTIDPPGSVTIIDTWKAYGPGGVRHVGFEAFDHPTLRAKLEQEGVRIFGPGASVSQDLEPEYIATSGDIAYVTLQENNALAIIDIANAVVVKIVALGLKDHSQPGNGLDPSDRDNGINIANWPVHGLYLPDAIAAFRDTLGRTFTISANEGDAREYEAFVEARRLGNSSYVLDPTVFPNAAALEANAALGRLNVSTGSGDLDGDGDFDRIDVFGARSVTVRDAQGRLVWDSGDALEQLSASLDGMLTLFNNNNSENAREARSDDKSIEPEAVVIGEVKGRTYAFVGLERDSGIVVLDLSTPEQPVFVTYVNNRKFPRNAAGELEDCSDASVDCGDLGPEGLTFVPASHSPTRKALLIVSNEVSSTTTIWQID